MILSVSIAFLVGILYATIFISLHNKKVKEELFDAYNMGIEDGKDEDKKDRQADRDMAYQEGYNAGVNDQKNGLIEEDNTVIDYEPWLDEYKIP